MKHPRLTKKEWGLIKGALRRVFSRSDLRKGAIDSTIVPHHFSHNKRVKTWCICPKCHAYIPKSYMVVDHIIPIILTHETLLDLDLNTLVDRIWCESSNLIAICQECHAKKTYQETQERKVYKRDRKLRGIPS